jgi:endonuclease/exonuclease/phosphatase family metal-dependent hydrolase
VYREIGGRRSWGSAVVGFTTKVEAITTVVPRASRRAVKLVHAVPGAVAVAEVPTRAGPLAVVSIYGLIENGYAVTTVNRQLSDLTPLLDAPAWEGRIILAGDLNLTTQWTGRDARYLPWHRTTLARIREFGLADCLDAHRGDGPLPGCGCADGPACRHIQTLFHSRSPRPWQNDYAFTSTALLPLVTSASPVNQAGLRRLSDHLPLVIDMDI